MPGAYRVNPISINNQGTVVGTIQHQNGGPQQAFVFENGTLRILPGIGGNDESANWVNEQGTILGQARDQTGYHQTLLWTPGGATLTVAPTGPRYEFVGHSVSNLGRILGFERKETGSPIPYRPARWQNGTITEFPLPADADLGYLFRENAHGVVIGAAGYAHPTDGGTRIEYRAVVWEAGIPRLLSADDATRVDARGIDDQGRIVGAVTRNNTVIAGIWQENQFFPLSPARTNQHTRAYSINRSGWIVGFRHGNGGSQAILWRLPTP